MSDGNVLWDGDHMLAVQPAEVWVLAQSGQTQLTGNGNGKRAFSLSGNHLATISTYSHAHRAELRDKLQKLGVSEVLIEEAHKALGIELPVQA
jgi:hypothetical protein